MTQTHRGVLCPGPGARPPGLATWAPLILLLAGCRAFLPPPAPPPEEAAAGETRLSIHYLRRDQTLEVEGRFEDGDFEARRIEVEEADDEIMLKGPLTAWEPGEGGAVGGVPFGLTDGSRIVDEAGADVAAGDVGVSTWVKAECEERDGSLELLKLELRVREADEAEELQGTVSDLERARGELRIGGVRVRFPENVLVVWDVEDQEPPPPAERGLRLLERTNQGLRRRRRRDDEDRRPEDQLTIGGFLTVGGEVQYELEWRNNHDLRDFRDRDRLIHQLSAKLEFSFDITKNLFAFAQFNVSQDIIHIDEEADREGDDEFRIGEAFALFEDIPLSGLSLQIGRQDLDYGREWVVDDQVDAFRAYVNLDVAILDLSVSSRLFNTNPESDGVTNYLAALFAELDHDNELFVYYMHREGGSLMELSRNHVGASVEGELADDLEYWADLGFVWGKESGRSVGGVGVDASLMYTFDRSPLEPYAYAGFAFGSGDADPDAGTDDGFRQTGLHDNNDKFGGVTSFRYLGELLRPEVSNLMVFTAGVGFRPSARTSIDLVYHHYKQVEPSTVIRDTRLRFAPTGDSREIGDELDLVIGIEDFRPLEIEIVLAWFEPGAAFGRGADDAWFLTFEIEYNF